MKRRNFFIGLSTCALPYEALAQENGWAISLIQGGQDKGAFIFGLQVSLAPGWKTYWRNPGEFGIAPQINVTCTNLKDFEIVYPMPTRISDEAGETIGYHDEVVFPILLRTSGQLPPKDLKISSFLGMCKEICVPAKSNFAMKDAIDNPLLIQSWRDKVPKPEQFITQFKADAAKLSLQFNQPVDDIFVNSSLRFVSITITKSTAELTFASDQPEADGIGAEIAIVANASGKGLEQVIKLK